ncbi:probable ornithine decarboxylase [Nephila pilipes]|uniref:ornithine decarboxylase n=1 Tax=Nephila pilipes TaxID=299642 RepID=A0A8X6UAB0_NEPPI|nr:probable ornithine decarboxylase [Nephila pilipes]
MKSLIRNEAIIRGMLQELKIKDDEEPFYVVDVGDVVLKWKEWKKAMPRVEPFYAVKCNPDLVLLHVLAALGVNFDCSTKKEIETVLNVGVQPSRIIYANTCKGLSHLKYADSVGVDLMTFDNEAELHKIKKTFPDARLVLRIKVDDSGSLLKLSLKFGCDLDEVPNLLDVAKDLHLNVVGVR